jgi:hypothetical protein
VAVITSCSLLKVNRRSGGTYYLQLQGPGIRQARYQCESWAYSSTLKMEVICSSERSADFQQTAQHYVPEDNSLQLSEMSGTTQKKSVFLTKLC